MVRFSVTGPGLHHAHDRDHRSIHYFFFICGGPCRRDDISFLLSLGPSHKKDEEEGNMLGRPRDSRPSTNLRLTLRSCLAPNLFSLSLAPRCMSEMLTPGW